MPVLSPHRSSASALAGTYRSTFSSSMLDRPYCSPASYSPRITSYSERYSSRSYTDADGRRIFSRSGSITEDGIRTSFREESREGSQTRRDSLSRDSGIGSIRENSILENNRRDSSSAHRLNTINVLDSVAELRNRYSPANYVPTCMRAKNDNLARSKSINDIGLPPIIDSTNNGASMATKSIKKKQQVIGDVWSNRNVAKQTSDSLSSCSSNHDANTNNNNNDKVQSLLLTSDDQNGNSDEMHRASVAELRRRFDDARPPAPRVMTIEKAAISDSGCQNSRQEGGKLDVGGSEAEKIQGEDGSIPTVSGNKRVNNFASYISTKNYQIGGDIAPAAAGRESSGEVVGGGEIVDSSSADKRLTHQNDISSPKLNLSAGGGSSNRCSVSPCSLSAISASNASNANNSGGLRRSSECNNTGGRGGHEEGDGGAICGVSSDVRRPSRTSPAKTLGLNGLKNIGNTCFMNSVIQCLSNTKLLLEYVRKDHHLEQINTNASSMKGALIKSFGEVIKELWSEDASDRVVNTSSLKSQIQRFAPRFIGYAQQDAQEFLRYFLEGLHEDVNRVVEKPKPILTEIDEKLSDNEKAEESWRRYLRMDNSWIVDCFVGQLKSTLRCTHCGHCSVTFDPFWDLSLPIPQRAGQVRMSQCLEAFTKEETLDGDEKPTCSRCKERRKCTKSFSIQKFPRILVIHLKRFSLAERFRGKLNVTVDFPLEGLDMSNYAADSVAPCRYNLYAVSNHSGTTYSGHYTAYCRHPYTRNWHEYNDSRVSSISPKSIVSGEAYVLFYEQDGHKSHL